MKTSKPSQTDITESSNDTITAKEKAILFLNDAQKKNKNSQIISMVQKDIKETPRKSTNIIPSKNE